MATRALILRPGYFPLFDKGKPVANGYIYIGEPDLDPEIPANQKAITFLQEDGSEVAGSQPVRTSAGGVPTYNGSPVTVLIDGDYSVKVLDKHGAQIYYVPKNADLQDSSIVTTVANVSVLRALTGAVEGQVAELVSYNSGWAATLRGPIGGGLLTADTTDVSTADNGVTVFVDADGTRWKRNIKNYEISVEWAGGTDESALIAAFKVAIDLRSNFSFLGSNDTTIPTIKYPAGRFTVDTTAVSPISAAAYGAGFPNRNAGIKLKGEGGFQTVIELSGTNWLWDVQNNMQWTMLEGLYIQGAAGTERVLNFYSTGGARHPRMSDVWIRGVKDGIWLDGAGNADHLRMDNCMIEAIPSGGIALNIQNQQSIAHVLKGTCFHAIAGTAIKATAGGLMSMFGGSVIMVDSGRFLHIEGGGGVFGVQNADFHFYNIKPEISGTSDFLYLDAPAKVVLHGGVFAQDNRSDKTADVCTIKRGTFKINDATWGDTWFIRNDGSFAGAALNLRPGDVLFRGSELMAELADIMRIDPAATSPATGRAVASGCYGLTADYVDVALNATYQAQRYAPEIKHGTFRAGSATTVGLPSSSAPLTLKLPKGATVLRVAIHHLNGGAAGADYQYEVADGAGTVVHTTAAITNTDDVVDGTGQIARLPEDASTQDWTVTNIGTSTSAQKGWLVVEWI